MLKKERVNFDISYCLNTEENFNNLLKFGSLAYSNDTFKTFKEFPYLILDENEFIDGIVYSAIGIQYIKEIEFDNKNNVWKYKLY